MGSGDAAFYPGCNGLLPGCDIFFGSSVLKSLTLLLRLLVVWLNATQHMGEYYEVSALF